MNLQTQPAIRKRTPRGQGKAKLLEAAAGLFAELGVSGTSLQAIANRLGVTKAAVYHQFSTKEGIVVAVAQPVIEKLRGIADAAQSLPPVESRAAVIEGLVDLALAERGTAAVIRRDPTMAQILDSHLPYREQITRLDAMLLGPEPTLELRVALAFAGGGIMAVGALPVIDGPTAAVRAELIAAMGRALGGI